MAGHGGWPSRLSPAALVAKMEPPSPPHPPCAFGLANGALWHPIPLLRRTPRRRPWREPLGRPPCPRSVPECVRHLPLFAPVRSLLKMEPWSARPSSSGEPHGGAAVFFLESGGRPLSFLPPFFPSPSSLDQRLWAADTPSGQKLLKRPRVFQLLTRSPRPDRNFPEFVLF
jgi:hypothetical protein